jgi:hypothetical protein
MRHGWRMLCFLSIFKFSWHFVFVFTLSAPVDQAFLLTISGYSFVGAEFSCSIAGVTTAVGELDETSGDLKCQVNFIYFVVLVPSSMRQ